MHPVAVVPAGDAHGSHSEAAMADVISAFAGQLSLLLALLFALHPMFVPMVAWIPTRGDLLLTIVVIISFILFIKSFCANRPVLVLWHGLTFFLTSYRKKPLWAVPPL